MAKVLFLDVDGVIAVPPAFIRRELLENLRRVIYQTRAPIVVSSSWRCEPTYMQKLDEHLTGIGAFVIGSTPRLSGGLLDRHLEILAWLEYNPHIDHYVAVDDMPLQLPSENFVHTEINKGLDREKADELIRKLQAQ
jgi:hypothetical protein